MGKKRIKTKDEPEVSDGAKKAPEEQAAPRARHMGSRGVAHVQATYNNTLINISDERGNVVAWSSSGSIGFRGSKKSTPFAAARVAEVVAEKAKKIGIQDIAVLVKGVGSGRESAIRSLANHGMNIDYIKDITPIPHNGPRPPKARRV